MVYLSLALSLLLAAPTAFAAEKSDGRASTTVPGAYIVEFDESANANQFHAQAEPEYETRMQFNHELFKGISIQLKDVDTAEDLADQLASLPAVKNIWPVKLYDRPEFEKKWTDQDQARDKAVPESLIRKRQGESTALGNAPHVMTQVDKLHARGITGEGITIAVIDTGIDYHHPAFGGCFGKGCVITHGYDLVGDGYNGFNTPTPDDDPDDTCEGHGTHVAGIIAARGENPFGFMGAAPGANLAAYRVFGCSAEKLSAEILISAFNRAYEEGADIITASISFPNGWSSDVAAVAISRIVEKGIPCTLAAGNNVIGLFDSQSGADGKGVTSVASFDNINLPRYFNEGFYTVNNGSSVSFAWEGSQPAAFDGVNRELWVTSYDLNNTRDACTPLPDDTPDLGEYNVLIRRSSECNFTMQAINIAAKGARFFIVYNDKNEVSWFDLDGVEKIQGAAMVTQETGSVWVKALEAGSIVKARLEDSEKTGSAIFILDNQDSGGAVSIFTCWGPTFEMDFKPQYGAPGGNIFSTNPLEDGSYDVRSGTSMATPFVAAAYALIAQARGIKPNPGLFENLLASTANPQLFYGRQGFKDWLAPAAQQGAGLIQVYDAAYTSVYLEPSSLSFNDTANSPGTLNFTIVNTSNGKVTFDVTHVPTNTLYTLNEDAAEPYWRPVWVPGQDSPAHAELNFSSSKVIIAAGDVTTIAVSATPPKGLDENRYPYWSGFIAVNGSDGSSLSLPYQGLSGSLKKAKLVLNEGDTLIVDSTGYRQDPLPANMTFTLPPPGQSVDTSEVPIPVLYLEKAWGSSRITADVVSLASNETNDTKIIGQAFGFPISHRPRGSEEWIWWGQLNSGEYAPAGEYKIVTRLLRIFGDVSKEEDWIVVESTPFKIRYQDSA